MKEVEEAAKAVKAVKVAKPVAPKGRFFVVNPESSDSEPETGKTYELEESEIEAQIKNFKPGYRNISDEPKETVWMEAQKAFDDFTAFRPSLEVVKQDLTFAQYSCLEEKVHLGRPMEIENNVKSFKATLWMYEPQGHESDLDTVPLDPKRLMPLMDLLGVGNEHIRSLSTFFDQKLPKGVPVQIDIHIGLLPLSARIRFQAISRRCDVAEDWFRIPTADDGYRISEIITSSG